ncbi:MAG: 5'-3' exonuclease H3TH domain-containing protein [Eubacteriales bacterium]|nr:5'-3' exonuclease H3TH domain-containing protein [Eubacteriales bacterium]
MPKLLIIDGHNLLFQMFFGMPSRIINKDGKAIQGTLGFVGALLKIVRLTEPTHIVALFDGEHENDRAELNAEYKANRTDYSAVAEENNPFSQLPDVYTALDFLKIKHTEAAELETDDVIASYAIKCGAKMQIVISSFDSDFFQLINDNVTVLRYRGDKTVICDSEYIQERLGVSPNQYADFKSLTGDSCDNIKGADKVGPKTAAQLISQFGTLNNILENAEQISKPSVRESIIENTKRLKVNYRLIMLDDKAPLPFTVDELQYKYDGVTTNEVLSGIGLR